MSSVRLVDPQHNRLSSLFKVIILAPLDRIKYDIPIPRQLKRRTGRRELLLRRTIDSTDVRRRVEETCGDGDVGFGEGTAVGGDGKGEGVEPCVLICIGRGRGAKEGETEDVSFAGIAVWGESASV
jgi:hypothetical protein